MEISNMKARNFHLVHSINSQSWHMRPESVWGYLPFAIAVMKGESPKLFADDDETGDDEYEKRAKDRWKSQFQMGSELYINDWYYDYPPLKINGNVVVIPIMGPIMQDDWCGSAGTKTIQGWYEKARLDPEVVGVIELVNSGGGSVFGTHELADYKVNYSKPIVSYIEGMCCSAAQYIAAGSSYRIASSPNCIVGSIGVMTTFMNFKKYYEAEGIDIIDLYSSTSPKKNDAYRKAQEGDFKGYTDGILFQMDKTFMSFIQQRLPNVSQEALQGADYTAQEGIKNGLIEEIGNFDAAYNKVLSLAQEATTSNNKTPNQTMSKKIITTSALLANLANFFGAEIQDDVSETDNSTPPAEEGQEKPDEEDAKDDAKQDAPEEGESAKDKQIEELNARILALEKRPVANTTKVTSPVVEPAPSGKTKAEKSWVDSDAEHVQKAKSLGLL